MTDCDRAQLLPFAEHIRADIYTAVHLHAEITICEPDQRVKVEAPSATPNDPLYTQQWNMKAINVDKVWAKGQFGDPQRRVRSQAPHPLVAT